MACRLRILGTLALLVGCGDPPTATTGTDTDDGTTGDPVTPTTMVAESSESGPEPICMPGEVQCSGEDALEICADDGLSWMPQPCDDGFVCVACDEEDPDCTEAVCAGPCDPNRLEASSAGCSFIAARQLGLADVLGPMFDVEEGDWPADGFVIVNPDPDLTATVQVYEIETGSMQETAVGDPVSIAPLGSELVELGTPLPLGNQTTLRIGGLSRVESDIPVLAYAHGPYEPFVGNDSAMLLPETSLGLHYIVPAYPPHYVQFQGAGTPTYFDIVATEDDTTVRWLAQFARTSGNSVPVEPVEIGEWSQDILLSRFGGVRVRASSVEDGEDPHGADVSGTVIEASAPIAVVSGSRCSAVPAIDDANAGCDPLREALIPLEQWGQTYVVPAQSVAPGEQQYYRIYAGAADLEITATPAVPGLPFTSGSRGEFVDVAVPADEAFVVEGTGPIMAVGYLPSRSTGLAEIGDPSMYQHIAVEQFTTRYVTVAPPDWTQQSVTVVRAMGGAEVLLDDSAVGSWVTVGDFETANVQIGAGTHTLASDEPFGAYEFGSVNGPAPACDAYSTGSICHATYAHPLGTLATPLFEP